jgi:hypothetical protein
MTTADDKVTAMNEVTFTALIRQYMPPAQAAQALKFYHDSLQEIMDECVNELDCDDIDNEHYSSKDEETDNESNDDDESNEDDRRCPRTEILNSDTPVTFKLDWNYCEKARGMSANPVAEEGVTTLMGPPSARFDEEFDNSDDDDDNIIISVAKLLRRSGQNYEVQIISDEYNKAEKQVKEEMKKEAIFRNGTSKRQKTEDTKTTLTKEEEMNILEQREFEFLKTYGDITVIVRDAKTKKVVVVYTTTGSTNDTPWIVIRCENDETTSNMMKMFNGGDAKSYYDTNDNDQYFILRTVPHKEKYLSWKEVLPIQSIEEKKIIDTESYRLEMVTGLSPSIFSKREETNDTTRYRTSWLRPMTMFKLYFINNSSSSATRCGGEMNKILVGKCLCSYKLDSSDECGPTIEMIEIADEWHRHGLGSMLLKAMYTYFNNTFVIAAISLDDIKDTYFFVHDTESYASRWLQKRHGFRDDGEGDLRKVFLPEDCEDED